MLESPCLKRQLRLVTSGQGLKSLNHASYEVYVLHVKMVDKHATQLAIEPINKAIRNKTPVSTL